MSEAAVAEEPVDRTHLAREAWIAAIGILALLTVVKHVAELLPEFASWAFMVAVAVQLFVPLARIDRGGVTHDSLGLRTDAWAADLRDFAVAAVVTGVPYAVGFHLWQTLWLGRRFAFAWPERFFEAILIEVLVIALAEELFFRGYLQERLTRLMPARRRLFGAPFGRAVLIASAVFALAHFAGEYRPGRLATFMPSLVFGLLFARRGSLIAPVAYHAFCNLLADVLFASHRLGPP